MYKWVFEIKICETTTGKFFNLELQIFYELTLGE